MEFINSNQMETIQNSCQSKARKVLRSMYQKNLIMRYFFQRDGIISNKPLTGAGLSRSNCKRSAAGKYLLVFR